MATLNIFFSCLEHLTLCPQELRGLHVQLKVITHHFIYGVHCLAQKRYTACNCTVIVQCNIYVHSHSLEKALVRSVCAYKMNCELAKKAGEKAGLDPLMLGLLRRKALLVRCYHIMSCIVPASIVTRALDDWECMSFWKLSNQGLVSQLELSDMLARYTSLCIFHSVCVHVHWGCQISTCTWMTYFRW